MNDDHVICVFCSSDSHVSDDLKEYTEQLGSYLGTKRMQVMTGGSEQGLMRSVANGYLKTASASGIRMIIPEVFRNKADKQHPALSEQNIVWVDSFRVQLEFFESNAHSFVILPGGYGTMLEFFHLLSLKKNSAAKINVILLNFKGFWDSLLSQLDKMVLEKVLTHEHRNLFRSIESIDQLDEIFSDNLLI